ncbi:MAG: VCBS repeat-containing protein [Bacteroidales bacterium]|nr:VCBS repeat-containing protein [Bacteroidales bacterium]
MLFTSLLTGITMGQNIAFEQVLPLPPAPQNIADFVWVDHSSIAFADIDNDNDQDVLIAGLNSFGQDIAKLYTNDGSGFFTEVTGTPFDVAFVGSVTFADIDNDNDQDVLITGLPTTLYTNDGNGFFTEVTGSPFYLGSDGAFADIDNDNDQDDPNSG